MADAQRLLEKIRDIREAISVDWADLDANPLREEERDKILDHVELCRMELRDLLRRLLELDE